MKKSFAALAALFLMVPALPANADYSRSGGVRQRTCYREVYREEYIPGTRERPGRVRRWTDKERVPCGSRSATAIERENTDDNSCIEGSILGGITGGAIGGVMATKKNWIWSIPAGVVGGAMVGCQVDGG